MVFPRLTPDRLLIAVTIVCVLLLFAFLSWDTGHAALYTVSISSLEADTGPVPEQSALEDSSALLDLNTASAEALAELPGIGAVLAQRIVEYRTQQGLFQTVEELNHIDGIGDTIFSRIQPLVTVTVP